MSLKEKSYNRFIQIRAFITMVQEGTLVKAAEKLDCHYTGLLSHIKNLEEMLGVELFKKQGRKFEITKDGEDFYKMALPEYVNIETLYEKFTDERMEQEKSFRIGGHIMALHVFMPQLLKLIDNQEQYVFEIKPLNKSETIKSLLEKDIDFGFFPFDERDIHDHPEMEFFKIKGYDIVAITPKGMQLNPELGYKAIMGQNVISLGENFLSRSITSGIRTTELKGNIKISNFGFEMGKEMVKQGLGITLCSRDYLTQQDKEELNVITPPPMLDLNISYYLLIRNGKNLTEDQKIFYDAVKTLHKKLQKPC